MSQIVRVDLYTIVQQTPEYSWSPVMPDVLNTDTIIRLTDSDGFEGIGSVCTFTEYGVDKSVMESIRPLAIRLLRQKNPAPETYWQEMTMRRPGVTNSAIAAIDFALWDLEAKKQNMPLHKLLGGTKTSIPAYASVPILNNPAEYVDLISELKRSGFSIFKFHYKSEAAADIALIEAVCDAHGHDCQFMFDAENLYGQKEAEQVAEYMSSRDFIWLEAPFDDHDWKAYHKLRQKTPVQIIPAGNSVVDNSHITQAIEANCWDAIRIDATSAGGITPALQIFDQSLLAGLNVECQSWGSSISTAANLHLAIAKQNSDYFEIPVPREDFLVPGTSQFELTMSGKIIAPNAEGIGISVDWPVIEKHSTHHMSYTS